MPYLVQLTVTLSPNVSYFEVYQRPETQVSAPFQFMGLFQVQGEGAQRVVFSVPQLEDVRVKIVPICCDGCEGTPFEYIVEVGDPTTTPPTTAPPTTLPPTTTEPTTTEPTTTDPDAPTTEPPYDYAGYFISPEMQAMQPHPTNYIWLRFRRGASQGNDRVRVYYTYQLFGGTETRSGSFEWADNTTNYVITGYSNTALATPANLGPILRIDYVERI